jgi:hypothetical protein
MLQERTVLSTVLFVDVSVFLDEVIKDESQKRKRVRKFARVEFDQMPKFL